MQTTVQTRGVIQYAVRSHIDPNLLILGYSRALGAVPSEQDLLWTKGTFTKESL